MYRIYSKSGTRYFRAIFLDRDGVLNREVDYISSPNRLIIYPQSYNALKRLKKSGYGLIVVSNQSGVSRGYFTEKTLQKINQKMIKELDIIDAVYYATYFKKARNPKYRKNASWRKPNPGMLLAAARRYGINLKKSYMIGDRITDIATALNAGCVPVLVKTGAGRETFNVATSLGCCPEIVARDIGHASRLILSGTSSGPG